MTSSVMPRNSRIFHHLGLRLWEAADSREVSRDSRSVSGSFRVRDLLERNDGVRRDCHGFFWDRMFEDGWRSRVVLGSAGPANDRIVSVCVAIGALAVLDERRGWRSLFQCRGTTEKADSDMKTVKTEERSSSMTADFISLSAIDRGRW